MFAKHSIFYLSIFSLILLSTTSLANYNFLQKNLDYDLSLKYICQNSKKTPNDKITISLSTLDQNQEKSASWKSTIWGDPFSNRVYGGMWTQHFRQRKSHIKNNQLMAFCYNGIYFGTFINSLGDRTYSSGVQRLSFSRKFSWCEIEIGYRLGGMYGYKKDFRLFDTGFFPLIQIVADININNFITQISWAGMVFTIGFGYKI